MKPVIGLTGTRGFIGRHIADHFSQQNFEVIHLDPWIKPEVALDNQFAPPAVDFVFHLAAHASIASSFENAISLVNRNCDSLFKALAISARHKSVFVYFSSYVYGQPRYFPIDEEHPTEALNPYMSSKLLGEQACRDIAKFQQFPYVILRPFLVYGPNLKEERLVGHLFAQFKKGEAFCIDSPHPIRDYLYIEDLCALMEKIIANKKNLPNNPVFNVGSGFSCSNLELAETFRRLSKEERAIFVKGQDRRNDVFQVVPCINKIRSFYEWTPTVNIESGISKILFGS